MGRGRLQGVGVGGIGEQTGQASSSPLAPVSLHLVIHSWQPASLPLGRATPYIAFPCLAQKRSFLFSYAYPPRTHMYLGDSKVIER